MECFRYLTTVFLPNRNTMGAAQFVPCYCVNNPNKAYEQCILRQKAHDSGRVPAYMYDWAMLAGHRHFDNEQI